MVLNPVKREKKSQYDQKLCRLVDEYSQILIVAADNVGSTQMQNIRKGLRGDSIVLMGKNTMMKRSIRLHADNTNNNAIRNLIPLLVVLDLRISTFFSYFRNFWLLGFFFCEIYLRKLE